MPHHRLLRRATGEFFHVFSSRRLDFTPIGAMLIDVERERPTRQLANHRRASNVEDHIFFHAGQSQSPRPVAAYVGVQPRHPRRQQQEEVQSATEQSRDAGYAERRVSKDRECVAGSDGATSRQTPIFCFIFGRYRKAFNAWHSCEGVLEKHSAFSFCISLTPRYIMVVLIESSPTTTPLFGRFLGNDINRKEQRPCMF